MATNPVYSTHVQAAMEDPNGTPGQTRGGVEPTQFPFRPPAADYRGHGPSPYAQNEPNEDPLALATEFPMPPLGPEG